MRSRVMYIEDKSAGLTGPRRIGLVTFSKTGATLHYGGRSFKSLKGVGLKANYFDVATGDQFWISGPRRDGADGLYGRVTQPEDVDADVADVYWQDIRGLASPPRAHDAPVHQPAIDDGQRPAGRASYRFGRKHRRIERVLNEQSGPGE